MPVARLSLAAGPSERRVRVGDQDLAREAAAIQAGLTRCVEAFQAWPALPADSVRLPTRVLRAAASAPGPLAAALRADAAAIVAALDALAVELGGLGHATRTPGEVTVHFAPDPGSAGLARAILASLEHARARSRQAALHLVRCAEPQDAAAADKAGTQPVAAPAEPRAAQDATANAPSAPGNHDAHPDGPAVNRPPRPRGLRRVHLPPVETPEDTDVANARVVPGPNVHAMGPVAVAELTNARALRPGAIDALCFAFPEASDLLSGTTDPVRAVAVVALALQRRAGLEVALDAFSTDGARLAIAYQEPEAGLEAIQAAARILRDAMRGDAIPVGDDVEEVRHCARKTAIGPSTQGIVDAARQRGIPVLRLDEGSFLQLGHGAAQRRIQASLASTTSGIGMEIADDKDRTKRVLHDAGIRVPLGLTVDHPDDAVAAARDLGHPVVLKPLVGNHGRGVTTNVRDETQVRAAFALASAVHPRVLVEHHIEGRDFRVLVVGGKLVAAARRDPAHVVGDGRSTIEQLVAQVNADPRRGDGHEAALSRIVLDEATHQLLARHGQTTATVPAEGERVDLKGTANLSTGGTATDVTDELHPDVRRACERAARAVGLDIMGLDIVAPHLRAPLEETRGAVVEVNAAPGLRMHLYPSHGKPRDVASKIVEMLFPPATSTGRVPIVAVTGTNGKTTTTRLVAHMLATSGLKVGLATTSGVEVDGGLVKRGDYAGPDGAGIVLKDSLVEAAVLEVARGGILRRGLGFDQCDVGVLLNVGADHLGEGGVDTLEDLARVKGVVLQAVAPGGVAVVHAEDPLAVAAWRNAGAHGIPFALDLGQDVLRAHRAAGGVCVATQDGWIVAAGPGGTRRIARVADVPLTFGGRVAFNVLNALAATAAGLGLGLEPQAIAQGLASFQPDARHSPGRMNLFALPNGARALVDYGHNAPAIRAVAQALDALGGSRRIGVASASGNRRARDIEALGVELAAAYDQLLVTDPDPRGREPGETMGLVARAAKAAGAAAVEEVPREADAVARALSLAHPDDLVVLHVDDVRGAIAALEAAGATPARLDATPEGGQTHPREPRVTAGAHTHAQTHAQGHAHAVPAPEA